MGIALKYYLPLLVVTLVATWLVNTFLSAGQGLIMAYLLIATSAVVVLVGAVEYVLLPVIGLTRLGALVRVTYYEALLQPFTLIVMALGVATILIFALMPFFTQSEDTKMYRDVAANFVLLFPLAVMVFATAKVIDEEIENRTMLTLMSKPIAHWQVIAGKYLGLLVLLGVCVAILGIFTAACAYLRFFDDMRIDLMVVDFPEKTALYWRNTKATLALLPICSLHFLQLATLTAVSVAISTRFGLAINMTATVSLYLVCNLTRFVHGFEFAQPWQWLAEQGAYLLPFLSHFDLDQRLIYGTYTLGDEYLPNTPSFGQIWGYVAAAAVYAVAYSLGAIGLASALFRKRELA